MRVLAFPAVLGAELLWGEGAVDADLFGARTALDAVEAVALAPEPVGRIEQRLRCGAGDDRAEFVAA